MNSSDPKELALRRERQLTVLSRVNQKINENLEINAILRALVEAALEITDSQDGTAGLFIDGKMVFKEYLMGNRWIPINYSFPPGYGVPGWVIQNIQPYISNDTVNDPHVIPEIREKLGFYNLADTPILDRNGGLLGCFEIHNTVNARPFDQEDISLLKSLSASAAVALENAKIIKNLKTTQSQLRESQAYLQSIFEETPVSLWEEDFSSVKIFLDDLREKGVHDLGDHLRQNPAVVLECSKLAKVTNVNKATLKLFNAKTKADLLIQLEKIFTEESLKGFCEELICLISDQQKAKALVKNKTLDGREIDVLVKVSILPGYEQSWEKIIVSMIDLTKEKEIDRMKSEFISTAAHELRTPLTVLLGYADLILDHDNEFFKEPGKDYVENIQSKGLALEKIIDDLLDVGKIETGRPLVIEKTKIYIDRIIIEVAKEHQKETKKHFIETKILNRDISLLADPDKISQILNNLIGNAIKYSPDGGEVIILGKADTDQYLISISDQGIGMTAEQVQRSFEKFYRADSSNTAVSGLGLGLTIAKNIVAAHDGEIWIEGNSPKGTTVTFTIPLENDQPGATTQQRSRPSDLAL